MGIDSDNVQIIATEPPRRSRMLKFGDSVIARSAILITSLLMLTLAGAGWWTAQVQRSAMASARADQLMAARTLLREASEILLSEGDVSALRRLVAEARRTYQLSECQVILPDDRIIASAEPSQINVRKLPDVWPSGIPHPAAQSMTAQTVSLSTPLKISGHGSARLHLAAPIEVATMGFWDMEGGILMIGMLALLALLLIFRRMRIGLRGIAAIRDALLAAHAGEKYLPALAVGHDFGAESQAWNRILLEREQLAAQVMITKAREMITERRANKGDLESAFDAMSQGLILLNEKLQTQFVNGAAAVFLRAKRDEMIGGDITRWIGDANVVKAMQEMASGKVRRRSTLEVKRADEKTGSFGVLRFSIRPVRKEDAAAVMLVIEDVTQQRVADEARNSFVAQATHELRTPLTNIRLYVETAIDEGEDDAAVRAKCLNVINQEARRLERIVSEMLSVSEIEAGSFRLNRGDLRLDALFAELQKDFQAQSEDKRLQLQFSLPPKLPAIKADREKVTLALHNLVGNALKYTPAGGKVMINVTVSKAEFRVDVVDTGIGISLEDQKRVFEKFYRAKDPRVGKITGTGLGLTLAREVIRLHGGDITVDSKIDHGSTFTLSLPINVEAV